jgi:hypothetical protein
MSNNFNPGFDREKLAFLELANRGDGLDPIEYLYAGDASFESVLASYVKGGMFDINMLYVINIDAKDILTVTIEGQIATFDLIYANTIINKEEIHTDKFFANDVTIRKSLNVGSFFNPSTTYMAGSVTIVRGPFAAEVSLFNMTSTTIGTISAIGIISISGLGGVEINPITSVIPILGVVGIYSGSNISMSAPIINIGSLFSLWANTNSINITSLLNINIETADTTITSPITVINAATNMDINAGICTIVCGTTLVIDSPNTTITSPITVINAATNMDINAGICTIVCGTTLVIDSPNTTITSPIITILATTNISVTTTIMEVTGGVEVTGEVTARIGITFGNISFTGDLGAYGTYFWPSPPFIFPIPEIEMEYLSVLEGGILIWKTQLLETVVEFPTIIQYLSCHDGVLVWLIEELPLSETIPVGTVVPVPIINYLSCSDGLLIWTSSTINVIGTLPVASGEIKVNNNINIDGTEYIIPKFNKDNNSG